MDARSKAALEYHTTGRPGKIEVIPTKALNTERELSLAYSPGVAVPCLAIRDEPDAVFKYTARGNLVAVVSNGTRADDFVFRFFYGRHDFLSFVHQHILSEARNSGKSQTTITNFQTNLNNQISNRRRYFGHCNLRFVCDLCFGICDFPPRHTSAACRFRADACTARTILS